mmetsp:Transcript_12472/g.34630  ORF Transcript_12472/g.34630 Transcript_12472/m.34630 type:complete len:441 (+) Transcript_12472:350-1672(+)
MFKFTAMAIVVALYGIPSSHAKEEVPSVVVADYGVDCSFPIHSKEFKCDYEKYGLGDRKKFYEDFMQGCRDYYGPRKAIRCDTTEEDRIEMSIRQPQSMVNYTNTGFKKIRAPKEVMDLLNNHWVQNKDSMKKEIWNIGNVYVNHWESPTYMVSVEDTSLRGGGAKLKQQVWDNVKPVIEEWTGMEQKATSQYGIRVYTEGAVLSPHVDRLPLVSSCIINVAQDVDEPWILEVIDRQGKAVNVTMDPGDMVLYESGSLIHARPYPLKGKYFANIFIHFEPTGKPLKAKNDDYLDTLDDFFPPYILRGSPEEDSWAARNPQGWHKPAPSAPLQQAFAAPPAHHAAAIGDMKRLRDMLVTSKRTLVSRDENGWEPLHEAVRSGHLEAVEFLVKEGGANINSRTGPTRQGSSPLTLALEYLNVGSSVTNFLMSQGAVAYEDEL